MFVDAQQPPWRVVRAFAQDDGSSLVHLHNVSGGVLSGDHLKLDVEVGAAAKVLVTTTGATRLYRHRHGLAGSEQHTNIQVREGALLEFLPDPLIPFAGSRHLQRTTITLEDRATLLWWEVLNPGRQAMGEVFAFDQLRLEATVRSAERPLLMERVNLEPAKRALTSASRLGPYTHAANFYAFSLGKPTPTWAELEATYNEFCGARSSPGVTIWGSSALGRDGIAVRGLSVTAREMASTLAAIWSIAKRTLTGEDAILPRKVY